MWPFSFVLTPLGSPEAHCITHRVSKTLYKNLIVKHALMCVGGGNDCLCKAHALVLKCICPRKDGVLAGCWGMAMTGGKAIQYVWTMAGMGIDAAGGAVIISVAISANQIVSTDLFTKGGKELSNVDVFNGDQAVAREHSW